jgi:hypothetical protein
MKLFAGVLNIFLDGVREIKAFEPGRVEFPGKPSNALTNFFELAGELRNAGMQGARQTRNGLAGAHHLNT